MLYKIADAALEHPDESVRDVVFPVVNEQTLRDLVAEYKAQGGALYWLLRISVPKKSANAGSTDSFSLQSTHQIGDLGFPA